MFSSLFKILLDEKFNPFNCVILYLFLVENSKTQKEKRLFKDGWRNKIDL